MSASLTHAFLLQRKSLMWRVMRIVRDRQVAEDLAQEAYLRARRAQETAPIEHPEGFLHQTARNLALDHVRRLRTRGGVEVDAAADAVEAVPDDRPTCETALIYRERLRALNGALAALPPRVQSAVVLSRIEGWTNARIAAHLGVSERTVFNDLKMAMGHCRSVLARLDRA
ncbi:RNA polymerase sigma factor [Xanthobacter pseudotagetidis]|uniref:RNA polymerase sigma factor n=1 Tax=Xanthobacter pseudotagetidis TaxID=3119911 RepID=UPI00372C0B63